VRNVSALAVLDGSITFVPEPFSIEPWSEGASGQNKWSMSRSGLTKACELANRASRSRSRSRAASYAMCESFFASYGKPAETDKHSGAIGAYDMSRLAFLSDEQINTVYEALRLAAPDAMGDTD